MTVHFKEQVYDATPLSDVEDALPKEQPEDWKPSGHELLIIITLAIISLLVALDASIIVTSLGVSQSTSTYRYLDMPSFQSRLSNLEKQIQI